MNKDELLADLRQLETDLHSTQVRKSVARLDVLLDDSFREVGYSGHYCNKREVLDVLPNAGESKAIWSQDFKLSMLGEKIALLRYRSALVEDCGRLSRHSRRASVWVRRHATRWRLRYHQGTPTHAFEKTST